MAAPADRLLRGPVLRIKAEEPKESPAVIKVIGVGGAGGNAVNRMAEAGLRGVELISANSDNQALRVNQAEVKIQLGESLTRGLGVGGDSVKGRMAALESEESLREVLTGADLAFVTGGMGGGTGTGAAPIVAGLAKESGALTIGVVTRPFRSEGLQRAKIAEEGIQAMREAVDVLLIIPNERLLEVIERDTALDSAFRLVDDVLRKAIQSISDVITMPGLINMDLNDLRANMKDAGEALIGMGEAKGEGRAAQAARAAVDSPLLENVVIDGAKGLIVNITGRKADLKLSEVEEAMAVVTAKASPDAKIKVGTAYDESLAEVLRITVIATGFPARRAPRARWRSSVLGGEYAESLRGGQSEPGFFPDGTAPLRSSPEEWLKPAYLRLKARKLK